MKHRLDPPAQELSALDVPAPTQAEVAVYESPAVTDLGSVREVTQGNAKNGECDVTTQYYN